MGIRILSYSSSDLLELEGVDYCTVPLKIMFGGREYVDEIGTDCEEMVLALQEHTGPSTTSCPNVHEWLEAFEGADEIFGITISSGLSGSYESAEIARKQYVETHPQAKVFIFDSHATGPVERLIIEKLREGILAGDSYDDIMTRTIEYQKSLRILYALESLNNLANNGRVNAHVARIAGVLNIRTIGHASNEGTIELLHNCRGEKRTLKTLVHEMVERGCVGGTVHIDHCLNLSAATALKNAIELQIPEANVQIHPCTALCSYYADKGGLIIGYEVIEG
ncbi:MAG: DegV family EDD domain-containing protein [Eggerthellaceae bacterium]|nr:DegV family EDD domain-containing protein [Eggerthellaceae bacterium]